MIATIRVVESGNFNYLCDLDLMKYSLEQVKERMNQRGISETDFYICGFKDWKVDSILSLEEAFKLKRVILEVYDNDDFIVSYLLSRHFSVSDIMKYYYAFVTKDEVELMIRILKKSSVTNIVLLFYKLDWSSAVRSFIESKMVLCTPKGYYVREGVLGIGDFTVS